MSKFVRRLHQKIVKSGITRAGLSLRRSNPTILMYHGIAAGDPAKGLVSSTGLQLRASVFVEHLKLLRRWRKVIPLSEMVRGLRAASDMRDTVAITFDDGYENNYTRAAPLLADFKMSASFFLSTGYIGVERWMNTDLLEWSLDRTRKAQVNAGFMGEKLDISTLEAKRATFTRLKTALKRKTPTEFSAILEQIQCDLGIEREGPSGDYRFMSWDQVRDMAAGGFEIGAHTVNHPILSQISTAQAIAEIAGSRDQIRNEVGNCSPIFCYPNGKAGEFPDAIVDFCKEHFVGALSTLRGPARLDELYALRRLGTAGGVFESNLEWALLREI